MSNTDPFLGLYNTIKEATAIPSSMFIGVASSGLPNLKIKFEGIELDKDDFLVNSDLIKEAITVGEKVLIVKVNDTYIVLSKVVSL